MKKQLPTNKPAPAVSAARRAAFDVLLRVTTEDAFATNLLAAARYDYLSREDRALLQELALGVLRWQSQLDFLIEHYARRPLAKLDPAVVIALRLGLYQLRFLTRVPAHAAINEAVNLVKANKLQSAAPLVNAVLRAAARTTAEAEQQLIRAIIDPLQRLSIETAHPAWLLARWQARFGIEQTRELALANNAVPRTALRFNQRRAVEMQTQNWLSEHGVSTRASTLTPGAFIVESGALPPQAEPVRAGWLYLQDEASQFVAHLAAGKLAAPQTKALDLCAAPGGKTTLLSALLPTDALIVAADLQQQRLRTMKELTARLGATNIHYLQLDAAHELPFAGEAGFDVVLLDAPCTGLGTLQRHPEIKWRVNETKIAELAELQKRLLANAAWQVRAGGLLTYSVCSTEPEEGEEIIAQFRREHPAFRDLTRERLLELGLEPASLLTSTFGARTFTHRQGAESFFVCVLWKRK